MKTELNKQHNKFLNIAEEIAEDSKCVQLHVGALLVRDKRIISTGYNGTPSNFINCIDYWHGRSPAREEHHEFSMLFELHAELNCILYAARNGNNIENCDMYITHHPCANCLKMLCGAGIKNIYYRYSYDKVIMNTNIINMLTLCGINLCQIQK